MQKREKIIICSVVTLLVVLGLASFLDRGLGVGLALLISFSSFTCIFLWKSGVKEKPIYVIFLITLLVYLLTALFFHYTKFQPFGNKSGDYEVYHLWAQELAIRFRQGNFSLAHLYSPPYFAHYFPAILGVIYLLTLPKMIIPLMLEVWLVGLSAIFIYLIVKEIGKSEKWAFLIGLISIVYPSHIFYGSFLLKDNLVIILSLVGLLFSLKLIKSFCWRNFLIFYLVLTGLTHFRFYVGYALIFTFVPCWFLLSKLNFRKRIVHGIIMIFLLGFIPEISMSQGYYGINSFRMFFDQKTITYYRQREAGFTDVVEMGFDSPPNFLRGYLHSFINVALGPFPWQMKHPRHLLVLPEMLFWYFLLFFIIKGIPRAIRANRKIVFLLVVFSLAVFGVMALFLTNFGIITRIRMSAFLSLFCLVPFGVFGEASLNAAAKDKITFFLPTLEPGGAERSTLNLIRELHRKGFNLSLLLGRKMGYFLKDVPEDIQVVSLGTLNSFSLLLKLRKYFLKEQPGVFVSNFPRYNVISILAKIFSGAGVKIIVVEHNPFSSVSLTAKTPLNRLIARFIFPYLMRFLYSWAEAVVCVSQGIADDLLEIIRVPKKIRVIYNPILDDRIYALAKESVKHHWFSDPKIPVVLAAGRLVGAKDYPNLLLAFSLVCQKQPARLVILGQGKEKEKLEKLAEKLGLSENVAFLGFQENPYKYMAKASIFVLSSIQEGFPTVLIEAMACGLPIVSTDCKCGPDEIIADGENGLLVPPRDKEALAQATMKLLRNPFLRQKFSEEGKKTLWEFGVKKSAKEYERLFLVAQDKATNVPGWKESSKMKICYVTNSDMAMKFILLNHLKFLKREGFNVFAVCPHGKWTKDIESQGIRMKEISLKRKISPFSDLLAFLKMFFYFQKEKFQIVHTHNPKPGLYGQFAAKIAGIPISIHTIHGLYFTENSSLLRRIFFALIGKITAFCSDLVFSVNHEDVETVIKEKISSPQKIKYLGNGIDLQRFSPDKFSKEFIIKKKKDLGIAPEKKIIGIVGRLVQEKGYLDLFKAFREVLKRFPGCLLLIAGPIEPDKRDAIKPSVVKDYGIGKNVIFLGEREDMEELYSIMDVFVLPSHREGLPYSILEASAMERPVIATDIRGCREVIEHGKNGILVPLKNAEKLAEAIIFLFENPQKARELGKNARERAQKEFDETQVFSIIKQEYKGLLERKLK